MIKIKSISKRYANNIALNNININIAKNTIVGLLGQNGAGKTTLLDIITGCTIPDSGDVIVNNISLKNNPNEVKKLIAYVPEKPPLYYDLTVLEYLNFVGNLKQIIKSDLLEHINEIIKLTGLVTVKERLIGNLSKGFKQRLGIAQALIGNSPILIFDEPTVGLDPKHMIEVMSLIKKLSNNHTIIISSHRLYEIQELCSDYIILHKGEVATTGKINGDLNNSLQVEIIVDKNNKHIIDNIKTLFFVKKIEDTPIFFANENMLKITVHTIGEPLPEKEIYSLLSCLNVIIYSLKRREKSLEQIFLNITA
ncbi:MAG: ABC transporter ATP-binding protein [Christensenellaceae bacterium]|nr:ABC transporter ATP-binding protein [Christensenellaceae bacterium]